MTRRELLGWLSCLSVSLPSLTVAVLPRTTYGYLDYHGHRRLCARGVHLHIWYQGQDVTHRCPECSDAGKGWARLFLHDANGRPYWDRARDKAADEIVTGITLREGAPFK